MANGCSWSKPEISGEVFIVTQSAQNFKLGLVEVMAFSEADILKHVESKKAEIKPRLAELESVAAKYRTECGDKRTVADKTAKQAENSENSLMSSLSSMDFSDEGIKRSDQLRQRRSADAAKAATDKNSYDLCMGSLGNAVGNITNAKNVAQFFNNLPVPVATATTNADGKFTVKLPKSGRYVLVAHSTRKVVDASEEYYWMVRADLSSGENKNLTLSNNNYTDSESTDSLLPVAF